MKPFDVILRSRENFIKLIDGLSLEQLNKVPEKFNNNIIWNFAHTFAAQQGLCYGLSDNPFTINPAIIEKYKKGTKPEGNVTKEDVELYKKLAIDSLHQLETDFNNGLFTHYKTYTTSFGVELHSVESAIQFMTVHDGLHYGYAMALRKLVI